MTRDGIMTAVAILAMFAFIMWGITWVVQQPTSDIVSRYIDQEAAVVCWTYQSSISCLPLSVTALAR